MTCKPGNPSIKFIGTDGWVGNTGWRGELQASSKGIKDSQIGPEATRLYTNLEGEHTTPAMCPSRKDPTSRWRSGIGCRRFVTWRTSRSRSVASSSGSGEGEVRG